MVFMKKDYGIDRWDKNWNESFQKQEDKITSAPILVALDWKKPFKRHIEAPQAALGGNITQMDDKGKDRVMQLFSKNMTDSYQN